MNLKNSTYFLGLGCCGGKISKCFYDLKYKGGSANGSEQDLKSLGNIPNKYHLKGFDGFGGHRELALDCLALNDDFMNYINNINEQIIFIPFGGGGSTGSGCATMIIEMLLEEKNENGKPKKIICPIIALPSSNEPIVKHQNAYQAVQELQEIEGLGSTFFINNDIDKDYNYINTKFTELLDMFLENDTYGTLNNFDQSERIEMLRDGSSIVLSLGIVGTKKNIVMERLTLKGIFAPIERDNICEHIAIIHAATDNLDIDIDTIITEIGTPKNVFEGYNGHNTLVIASGLSYPVSHVKKLGVLAQKRHEERQRNKKQSSSNKLGDLKFMRDEEKSIVEDKKKPSKLELLRKRQAQISS